MDVRFQLCSVILKEKMEHCFVFGRKRPASAASNQHLTSDLFVLMFVLMIQ